jgi:hypothetical protein
MRSAGRPKRISGGIDIKIQVELCYISSLTTSSLEKLMSAEVV